MFNYLKMKCKIWFAGVDDNRGISTIEVVLLIVVAIGLVVIFKSQLTSLIQSIFNKITSESSGI